MAKILNPDFGHAAKTQKRLDQSEKSHDAVQKFSRPSRGDPRPLGHPGHRALRFRRLRHARRGPLKQPEPRHRRGKSFPPVRTILPPALAMFRRGSTPLLPRLFLFYAVKILRLGRRIGQGLYCRRRTAAVVAFSSLMTPFARFFLAREAYGDPDKRWSDQKGLDQSRDRPAF